MSTQMATPKESSRKMRRLFLSFNGRVYSRPCAHTVQMRRGERMNEDHDIGQHQVQIIERNLAKICGVLHVESFDDQEVVLETEHGVLAIQGEQLHIRHLDLAQGKIDVEGSIHVLEYLNDGPNMHKTKSKGLLERLFR